MISASLASVLPWSIPDTARTDAVPLEVEAGIPSRDESARDASTSC